MNIYDVTNPAHPTPLAEGVGDETVPGQGKKAPTRYTASSRGTPATRHTR